MDWVRGVWTTQDQMVGDVCRDKWEQPKPWPAFAGRGGGRCSGGRGGRWTRGGH